MKAYLLDAQQAAQVDDNLLGGKASNLAWLSRYDFPVPQWWVLTTDTFVKQVEDAGLISWLNEQVNQLNADSDSRLVANVAQAIQDKFDRMELAEEIKQAIRSQLPQSIRESAFLAIRSSVVGEDGHNASFAGQMDSYLYQQGETAIFSAVLKVMRSAFNHRALMYRLQKSLPVIDIRAAIIIQEMIDADVSGVMFTAHPVTGSRQHALISSAWGCGEGIVSGVCNTDEFTVALYQDDIVAQLNDKDQALVFNDEKSAQNLGTKTVAVEKAKRDIASLTQAQILALRSLGLTIAKSYQTPQDIEWCLQGDTFYILQARPITSLPPINSEQDQLIVWDNSNIQESYCGVTTPLTFSFANRAYKTVYEQTLRLLGVKEQVVQAHQDMLANMLGLIHGRVFYNINNWYRGLLFLPAFKTNKADMERMMGLTDPVDLIQDKALNGREKLKKLPQMLRASMALFSRFRKMKTLVVEFKEMFDQVYQSVDRQHLHTLTIGQLMAETKRLDQELLVKWTTPIVNDFYVMMMNGKVHRWLTKAGVVNPDVEQNNLLSGQEGIESTEPTKYLLALCDELRQKPKLKALVLETSNSGLLTRLQVTDIKFYQRCLTYIELYGDRTIGELKLESISLRQDASFMFAILKNFLLKEDLSLANLAANEAKFRQQAEQTVFPLIGKKFGLRGLKKFKRDLDKLRNAICYRENMRLARTRMFGLYRDIYLEIGQQLLFYGKLTQARDVFYLTVEELQAYNDGRSTQQTLMPLVAARKIEFSGYESEELPHHFITRGSVYCNNDYQYPYAEAEQSALDTQQLTGTGCYPGIVDNKVRLIFSPDDELSVNGQILCTVRTDPGWAPLFPTAAGLLVERGSTLSHSAVVARELGIPAIVGIPGITKVLQDQERVRMDGSTGVIERLEVEQDIPLTAE